MTKKIKVFISIILIISTIFLACNHKKSGSRDIQLLTDSSAYNNSSSTDSSRINVHRNHPGTTSGDKENSGNAASGSAGTAADNGTSSASPQSSPKKGWSKAAQGAVIGGTAGAVGGAIISKKKGTGAAIGAVAGAAGGYIIGRAKDKKDGRVKK
jgi:hypothetical protein